MSQCLVFTLDERLYGVRLSAVSRVVRAVEITPLPRAPPITASTSRASKLITRRNIKDDESTWDTPVILHTSDFGKGTRLGLAIVYGIVKQSGGFIWCDSEPGNGCTCVIHFPASEAARPAQEFSNGKPELLTGTETLLLAEDEQMLGNIMDEVLVKAGYTVVRAASGREALEMCRSRGASVDLIVSDVVTSGYPDLGDVSQILPGPHDVSLKKPVSVQLLLSSVRKVLDRITQGKLENNKEARQ
jgi:hypothetical protein